MCSHSRQIVLRRENGEVVSRCRKCSAEIRTAAHQPDEGMPEIGIESDPYTYPNENGAWLNGRLGITTGEARAIQRRNKALRENSRRSPQGGYLRASIPAALFWGQQKTHGKDYWKDPKNLAKVTKDWGVHEDRK